ncbi:zinc finger protein ZAT9-like isoform X2 [Euphorbia lathyris]|uniref:zinc finger protein ZAT9-like isoform X2 n=1 Tax=Euphorbia lathyris TaxID=212925 RepID=UPI003313D368
MERHRCKLCYKSFSNGRALGGHMRSHMLNLPIPQKPEDEIEIEIEEDDEEEEDEIQIQLSEETESASSSSSEDGDDEEKEILYGLRENPKRSIRLVDPEFSSVVLQDRESETESSKNPTRRRSKRTRKLLEHQYRDLKKLKFSSFTESWTEPEQPVSSISDTTTEEDVAFCLMMLSRDNKWRKKTEKLSQAKHELEEEEETEESEESKSFKTKSKGKYKCETCNKVFKSYQALGGHRASHKKLRLHNPSHNETELDTENAVTSSSAVVVPPVKKIHECPYCLRVFSSGQALGGHKRSHNLSTTSRGDC